MKTIFTYLQVCCLCLLVNVAIAQDAPDFTITDIEGIERNLYETLDAGYIVMIDFFFVACPPCQASAPEIQAISEDYADKNVVVWSISDRDSNAAIEGYENQFGLDYPAAGSEGGGAEVVDLYSSNFNFTGFPTIAIVCPDRSINWDIWPYSTGAPEWRDAIEACGVTDQPTSTKEANALVADLVVRPNVVRSTAMIDYQLLEGGSVRIELVNTLGQTVAVPFAGTRAPGAHQQQLIAEELEAGTYFIKVQLNQRSVQATTFVKQ